MSASAEPDMPAKIRLPKMLTCASPPGRRPHGRVGEGVDVARDAGAVHQAADEQEHRHGDERKRVERVERALRDEVERQVVGEHVDDARDADREHDREAEHEQRQEGEDDDESAPSGHLCQDGLLRLGPAARARCGRASPRSRRPAAAEPDRERPHEQPERHLERRGLVVEVVADRDQRGGAASAPNRRMPASSIASCSSQRGRGGMQGLELLHPDLPALAP